MVWLYRRTRDIDLILGMMLSIALGGVVGVVFSHPLGHMIFSSAFGVGILAVYILGYSLGTLWLVGLQQGMVVVSAFVWCIILSSLLASTSMMSSVVTFF